ncbi:MAG: serine hydrolase [Bacteroidota bacterium]|nr:serine hydrolase [Bacteroidota bacterium]
MKRAVIFLVLIALHLQGCKKEPGPGDSPYYWPLSSPEAQGLDHIKIDAACRKARELGSVNALLVLRNGYLVAEEYYNGNDRNDPHQLWSVTKGFLSALVGIALDKGLIDDIDDKVMDYFPEYSYAGMDPRFNDITIRNLLTMRMGIDREQNNLISVVTKDNWISETFNLPLLYDPGTKFSYNSLQSLLLSAIITKVSGMTSRQFAENYLTGPMGIEIFKWGSDPQGNTIGGYDLYMTPREMAVLGYLYLNGGVIGGRQIISREWIDLSWQKTCLTDGSWGVLTEYNYGYHWWIGTMQGCDLFIAWGMGGQFIFCVLEHDLIVVVTSNPDISWENDQEYPVLELVSNYILSAI